ncbi:MAG: methyltransferase domain-containing protein [Bacteroidia bacterium]
MTNQKVKPAKPLQGQQKKVKPQRKFLGPVENLEQYVESDWWRRIFNSLYLKTDADVVDDINITREEIDLFEKTLNIPKDAHMLDLACGQGRHALEFARRGYTNIEGMDRSRYLIQRAKASVKKENLPVKFREGDARKLPFPTDSFDVVMILGNSFGYFENPKEDQKILREIARILKPDGKLLVDVANGQHLKDNFQARSWEWIDKNYFVARERSLSADGDRLVSREVITHVDKGVIDDRFYAERLYTEEAMEKLLSKIGFGNVIVHGEISPNSQRNQDLGMMASRHIVTAEIKKEWTPVSKKAAKGKKHVAVLMGDPTKIDPVKPEGIWDEDDNHTINQLKEALAKLPGYQFSFLNNHDTMYQDLVKIKDKVDYVFNLCDEGFANDARKELHVPSLLEMLGIPYSGSNPQCLAYCYDKSLVRGIAKEMGIPVPDAFFIRPEDQTFELPFNFPVIVKPNFGDSSIGITQNSVANNARELIFAINQVRERIGMEKPILVEEFLIGKDLSVGIIGNTPESYTILPIIEEDYSALPEELPRICGYEAKWDPQSPYWNLKSVPAELQEETRKFLEEACLKLAERLECRDYSRFDWRIDGNGTPKLLEANPNPGWCWDGHLNKMAKLHGLSYSGMLGNILQSAEQRLGMISALTEKPAKMQAMEAS